MFSIIFISCNEEPPVIEDVYYNVTFKVDQEETVVSVKENTKVTKPADPIKENSKYKGWYLDNELYDFSTVVTNDALETKRGIVTYCIEPA
ncbi:MAG: InlB B-repeat-containing protein [Bacilli bacterium]|nr:InlB B-repeat-containing protein [Bacilli bacterium]